PARGVVLVLLAPPRPAPAMAAVVSVFRTSLVAVPALSRVEPAKTSGPVTGTTLRFAADRERRAPSALQATSTVVAPRRRATDSDVLTNGVTPLAGMPTTTSPPRIRARTTRRAAPPPSPAPPPPRGTNAPPPPAVRPP